MITIGIKTIHASKFKEIKTYKDALRCAGHIVPDDESLSLFLKDGTIMFAPAYTKFQIEIGRASCRERVSSPV